MESEVGGKDKDVERQREQGRNIVGERDGDESNQLTLNEIRACTIIISFPFLFSLKVLYARLFFLFLFPAFPAKQLSHFRNELHLLMTRGLVQPNALTTKTNSEGWSSLLGNLLTVLLEISHHGLLVDCNRAHSRHRRTACLIAF